VADSEGFSELIPSTLTPPNETTKRIETTSEPDAVSRSLNLTLFVLLAIMWGLSFPAIAIGLEYLPPLLFAAFRYDLAAIVLLGLAIALADGTEWIPRGRNNFEAIIGGGIFLVAGNGLLFVGQQTVPSAVAAILQSLVPIVTALWAFLLVGERLSRLGVVGVGIGFVGIGFVVQPDLGNLLAGDTVGRLLIVGQVLCVSLGGVLIQRAQPTLDRVPLTGWAMGVGAILLHLMSGVAGELTIPTATFITPIAIAAVVYLGLFSTAIAFLIYFRIIHDRGAFEASLVTYLVPVVSTVVGVFALGETISPLTIVGFGLVVVGFGILKRRKLLEIAIDGNRP